MIFTIAISSVCLAVFLNDDFYIYLGSIFLFLNIVIIGYFRYDEGG